MSANKAIEILETYKLWSCGEGRFADFREKFPYSKAELNEAIQVAINTLSAHG